jgi:DNA repair exonuclease SbcCD ATPase subunit
MTASTAKTYGKYADTRIALQKAQQILSQTQDQYDTITALQQELHTTITQLTQQLAQRPNIESQYQQLVAYEQTARQLTTQRDQYDALQQQHATATQRINDAKQRLGQHIQRFNDEIQFIDGALVNFDT